MKAATILAFVLYLVLAELPISLAATKEKINDNLRGSTANQKQQNEGTRQSDPIVIKVLVEYKSEGGKNLAKKEALNLTYESHRFNLLGMEIAVKSLKLLQDNIGIERVDLDCEVDTLLSFQDEEDDDDDDDERESEINMTHHRQLIEQVPWGIKAIQADQVKPGPLANEVKVCIIDSGYQFHPDLPGRDAVTGSHSSKYSDQAGNRWNNDGLSHGTASAGIIAAIDNEVGVVGVLQNVSRNGFTLHISKGLDDSGRGSVSGVIEAIEGCIDAGSEVISMSLRVGQGFVRSFDNVLRAAYLEHDVLMVAAAGNDGNTTLSFPASYPSVMSVSAARKKNGKYSIAPFSNRNKSVEVAGPGAKIKTTSSRNRYKVRSGTSIATPYVAAVAALLRSYDRCSAQQVRKILLATALDLGESDCNKAGHGMVQAKTAIDMLQRHGCGAADSLNLLDTNGMYANTSCKPVLSQEIIRINAGGDQDYVDKDGNIWTSDKYYSYNTETRRNTYFTTEVIENTENPTIFQSERYGSKLEYSIPVEVGKYDVFVYFAEIYRGAQGPNKRIFSISIEEDLVWDRLDIYKEAGDMGYKAYVVSKRDVLVTDGVLDIEFIGIKGNAKVSAVEIHPS